MKDYRTILNEYVELYDDNTLIELEITKHKIDTWESLLSYLEWSIDHNFYTGHYWGDLYNYNHELQDKCKIFIHDDDYYNYIVEYSDTKGDIFICDDVVAIEEMNESNPVIKYAIEHYSELLTPSEFENISYIEDLDSYMIEYLQIPERLQHVIDTDALIKEIIASDCYIKFGGFIIVDYNII